MSRNELEIPSGVGGGVMLDVLQGFVHELRAAGLPVSMTENLDAMRGVEQIPLTERDAFREVLAATLVKSFRHRRAFDTVFDVYFSLYTGGVDGDGEPGGEAGDMDEAGGVPGQQGSGGSGEGMSNEELAEMLMAALMNMDQDQLRQIAAMAVAAVRGHGAGPPRRRHVLPVPDAAAARLRRARRPADGARRAAGQGRGRRGRRRARATSQARFAREEYERRLRELRDMIEAEIRRRLVADRGRRGDGAHAAQAAARGHRLHARVARGDAAAPARDRAADPRARGPARATAQAQEPRPPGLPLDGPALAVVRRRAGRAEVQEPAAVEARDHGGRRHLRLGGELRPVHAAVRLRDRGAVLEGAVVGVHRRHRRGHPVLPGVRRADRGGARVNTEADVVWVDGHSDYGHAFEVFRDRHLTEITPKTSIILLGDARNNYHAAQAWVLKDLRQRARRLYWLNPEPRGYWDTGDSIVSEYGVHCDGVYECRNLRQLQRFVAAVVEQ